LVLFGGVLTPNTNGGLALGTTALGFSALKLSSGAGIDFGAGDVAITHAARLHSRGAGAGYSFDTPVAASSGLSVGTTFTSSGNIHAVSGTTITVGGVAGKAIMLFGSTTFGIYAGSSAPAIAAGQGSIYLRTDGGSSLTRAYIQSSGSSNTWVGLLRRQQPCR
jgi:hypothetical protein